MQPQRISWLYITLLLLAGFMANSVTAQSDWIYTVKPGDTLWDLCLEFTDKPLCWMEIGAYNAVEYPPSLAPGTRIRFPIAWLKAKPAPARVVHVQGEVFVQQPASAWVDAQTGDELVIGSRLRTHDDSSATLRFADDSTLMLEANSEIHMDRLTRHGETGMVDSRLNLYSGAARSSVKKREPQTQFQITTPSAIAAVRGTEFRVSATANSMQGEVFNGEIYIVEPTHDDRSTLAEGYGIRVLQGERLPEPTPLLAAVVFEPQTAERVHPQPIRWQPLDTAAHYKVELLQADASEQQILQTTVVEPGFTPPPQLLGCATLRVSAVDTQGLQGMPATAGFCTALAAPAITLNKGRLQWPPMAAASRYRIESSANADFTSVHQEGEVTDHSFTVPTTGQTRYYRVVAIGAAGETGPASNSVSVGRSPLPVVLAILGFFLVAFSL